MAFTVTPGAVPGGTAGVGGLDKAAGLSSGSKTNGTSGSFSDLVKNVATEAMDTSKAADSASVQAVNGTISDLELVQVMTEAEVSLQRFKTVYEATKQSLDKILNMGI